MNEPFSLEPSPPDPQPVPDEPRIVHYSMWIDVHELARAAKLGLDPDMLINAETEEIASRAKAAVRAVIMDAFAVSDRWRGK